MDDNNSGMVTSTEQLKFLQYSGSTIFYQLQLQLTFWLDITRYCQAYLDRRSFHPMRICLSHQKELHWQTTTRIVHLQTGDNILRDKID